MVKDNRKELSRVKNPSPINRALKNSANAAMNPHSTGVNVIPTNSMLLPSFNHLSVPPVIFPQPCTYAIENANASLSSSNAISILFFFMTGIFLLGKIKSTLSIISLLLFPMCHSLLQNRNAIVYDHRYDYKKQKQEPMPHQTPLLTELQSQYLFHW